MQYQFNDYRYKTGDVKIDFSIGFTQGDLQALGVTIEQIQACQNNSQEQDVQFDSNEKNRGELQPNGLNISTKDLL